MSEEWVRGLAPWPKSDPARFGKVDRKPLSKMQRLVASFLARNWVMIPHVTHHDEADVTVIEQRRSASNAAGGVRLTLVPLLVKALAAALREFPHFNASLDASGDLVLKSYVNIGVAVDTPGGLLVPVVRDCDTKSVSEIATELTELSDKARTKGLPMEQMSGGCMTLTSLGHIGGTGFTPIINAPEVAILGVTRVRTTAVPDTDGRVVWRQMLPLSLSYDHRVINGADAARFLRFVADRLNSEDLFRCRAGSADCSAH
ncbi:2-oxo acid dehydrogenase subunit E2 [Caballeronia sp. LZ001]|uniref:2-oxo acid dehydrogenase subunit E2 n=1 Tax=Caballeronia sp. LZ001 TaxID=3038553 RepID=UPI00285BA10B|nr:2-oxo acid dehydrogenase subunit E2 [Caballeronia sp. LZ001]MDR5804836.1 2-oxo acid dehydrogenase subunit E2 [Caballeronia sp. LZ001]